jgi:Spy/CpxP family protein refolding chaperone
MEEGRASWFFNAASALTLTFQQQQLLINLGQQVRGQSSVVAPARRRMIGVIADGIASGVFDEQRIEAGLTEIAAASRERQPSVAQALAELHAGLSPAQRQSVVESIRQAMSGSSAQLRDERDQVRQRVNALTADAGLTTEQQQQIDAQIVNSFQKYATDLQTEAQARRKQLDALCQAFTGIYFEPTPDSVSSIPDLVAKTNRLVAFARALTALLTPAQRTRVAATLRQQTSPDSEAAAALPSPSGALYGAR